MVTLCQVKSDKVYNKTIVSNLSSTRFPNFISNTDMNMKYYKIFEIHRSIRNTRTWVFMFIPERTFDIVIIMKAMKLFGSQ